MKEAGTSCERLLPGSHRMQGGRFQVTKFKLIQIRTLNADNEENVMVLGKEKWEDLFGNSMDITSFNRFSLESSSENDNDIDINCNNKKRQTWTKTLNTAVM